MTASCPRCMRQQLPFVQLQLAAVAPASHCRSRHPSRAARAAARIMMTSRAPTASPAGPALLAAAAPARVRPADVVVAAPAEAQAGIAGQRHPGQQSTRSSTTPAIGTKTRTQAGGSMNPWAGGASQQAPLVLRASVPSYVRGARLTPACPATTAHVQPGRCTRPVPPERTIPALDTTVVMRTTGSMTTTTARRRSILSMTPRSSAAVMARPCMLAAPAAVPRRTLLTEGLRRSRIDSLQLSGGRHWRGFTVLVSVQPSTLRTVHLQA